MCSVSGRCFISSITIGSDRLQLGWGLQSISLWYRKASRLQFLKVYTQQSFWSKRWFVGEFFEEPQSVCHCGCTTLPFTIGVPVFTHPCQQLSFWCFCFLIITSLIGAKGCLTVVPICISTEPFSLSCTLGLFVGVSHGAVSKQFLNVASVTLQEQHREIKESPHGAHNTESYFIILLDHPP